MGGGMQAQMEELFAVIEGVSVRRMFGGLGIFRQGLMFALVADEILYMKADEATRAAYEAEGGKQWVYDGRTRPVPMPYWRLPDRLYDEPDEFRDWALKAFAVAQDDAKSKAKPRAAAKRPSVTAKKPLARGKAAKSAGQKAAAARKPVRKGPAPKRRR